MTSRDIAELCEKEHRNVLRDAEKMLSDLELDALTFEHIYRDGANREQREYRLPKDLTLTLVSGYRAELRFKIIKRLEELEAAPAFDPNSLTRMDLLRIATEAEGERIKLAAEVEEMRPEVEAHKRLTDAEGSLNITEAAKNLGVRPKSLFDWLSQNGWIYKRPGAASWLGYHDKTNRGLLVHKSTTVLRADGSERISEQVRVTPKGLSRLAKLVKPVAQLAA